MVPYDRGDLIDRAHREGEILGIDHLPEGTRLHLRAPAALASALGPYQLVAVGREDERRRTDEPQVARADLPARPGS
jgi:GTPase